MFDKLYSFITEVLPRHDFRLIEDGNIKIYKAGENAPIVAQPKRVCFLKIHKYDAERGLVLVKLDEPVHTISTASLASLSGDMKIINEALSAYSLVDASTHIIVRDKSWYVLWILYRHCG